MKQKMYFVFLMCIVFLFLWGCSNPAIVGGEGDKKDSISIGTDKKIPTREEVVKNEDFVINDRTTELTGADLYVNSKFMRSIIPASRFANLTRGREASSDMEFSNYQVIDDVVKELYEKATEEEKQYLLENIESISFRFRTLKEVDTTNDLAVDFIKKSKELGQIEDEIYNNLGLNEVAIETELNRNGSPGKMNLEKYRALNKYNRYRSSNEVIAKAYDLALYFLFNGDIEEVENINKMFNANIDIKKLNKFNNGKNTRGFPDSAFSNEKAGALNWFINNGINGDIVSRELGGSQYKLLYGTEDHAGMFNKDRLTGNYQYSGTKWARCILASYPDWKAPDSDQRNPNRGRNNYADYEPLANFIDVERCIVNRCRSWYYGYAQNALNTAISHFYGDGNKTDYDKWAQGYYCRYGWDSTWYDQTTEYCKTTDASYNKIEAVNYCSYISWYSYKKQGKNLDSDYERTRGGNMIVPDDLVNSANYQYIKTWVEVKHTGDCGEYTQWEYVDKQVYSPETDIVYNN